MSFVSNNHCPRLGAAGVGSVEFALVAVVFVLLMMGVFDFSRYLFTVQALEALTAEIARAAILPQPGSPMGGPACLFPTSPTALKQLAPLLDMSNLSPPDVVCWNPAFRPVTTVTVTLQYQFTASFFTALSGTLTESTSFEF
jgi:hypothetical protein